MLRHNGGISFGGVVAFIFADLIVLPIFNIYRKYYGLKMAAFLFATFYAAMAAAALIVEAIFGILGLVPEQRHARVVEAAIQWSYTNAQYRIPRARGAACLAIPENRWPRDAADDEQASSGARTDSKSMSAVDRPSHIARTDGISEAFRLEYVTRAWMTAVAVGSGVQPTACC